MGIEEGGERIRRRVSHGSGKRGDLSQCRNTCAFSFPAWKVRVFGDFYGRTLSRFVASNNRWNWFISEGNFLGKSWPTDADGRIVAVRATNRGERISSPFSSSDVDVASSF